MTAQNAHRRTPDSATPATTSGSAAGSYVTIRQAAARSADATVPAFSNMPADATRHWPMGSAEHSNSGRRLWNRSIATDLRLRGQRSGTPLPLAVPTTSTSSIALPMRRHRNGSRTLTQFTLESRNESSLVLRRPEETDTLSPERVILYPYSLRKLETAGSRKSTTNRRVAAMDGVPSPKNVNREYASVTAPTPTCALGIPNIEWSRMSTNDTSTSDAGSSAATSSDGAGLPNMRESILARSAAASSAFRTMNASALDAFTLEFRLKESLTAPSRRHTGSLSSFTDASRSYWMRVSERKTVFLSTVISSSRK